MTTAEGDVARVSAFGERFEALTDHPPYPWQESLYSLLLSGQIPENVNLPTGVGKTSIMAIWLLALAEQASAGLEHVMLPRRLVWVVNRRVVVDQATSEAEQIRRRLKREDFLQLEQVCEALKRVAAPNDDTLIGISTLRGQFADNAEWRSDPARPAVIVGTVDMVGSRLLFAGYGVGFKAKPMHAGFLGQDVLLVHDFSRVADRHSRRTTAMQ